MWSFDPCGSTASVSGSSPGACISRTTVSPSSRVVGEAHPEGRLVGVLVFVVATVTAAVPTGASSSGARSRASSTASVVPNSFFRKLTASYCGLGRPTLQAGGYDPRRDGLDLVLPLPAVHPGRAPADPRRLRLARAGPGRALPEADPHDADEAAPARQAEEEGVAG